MRARLLFALCASIVGLGGCSVSEPDFATAVSLDEAREKWSRVKPARYEMVISWDCDCDADGTALVTVENGRVTSASQNGRPAPASGASVDDLFGRIEEAYQTRASVVYLSYHPVSGYPVTAIIDANTGGDDETMWDIRSITALR